MTLLNTPPSTDPTPPAAPPAASDRFGLARWRLAARLAWRETRQRKGRTVMVMLLVLIPTVAMTMASMAVRSTQQAQVVLGDPLLGFDSDLFGGYAAASDMQTSYSAGFHVGTTFIVTNDPDQADASGDPGEAPVPDNTPVTDLDEIASQLPGDSEITFYPSVASIYRADDDFSFSRFHFFDVDNDIFRQRLSYDDGRAPGEGEIAISPQAADRLDVTVGDTLTLTEPSGSWTVSGIVFDKTDPYSELIIIPDFDLEQVVTAGLITVDLPDKSASDVTQIAQATGMTTMSAERFGGSDDTTKKLAVGWLIVVATFTAFGVVIVAAFATGASSQLVVLGQLSANGAPTKLLRRILALQGAWSALPGAVVGAAIAVAAQPFINPIIRIFVGYPITDIAWNPIDVGVIVATATLTGFVAALLPAISLSKVSVLNALAGHRPTAKVPSWMVPTGLIGFFGGLGLLILSVLAQADEATVIGAVIGVVAIMLGACLTTPLLIDIVGRLSRIAPLGPRLSLRALRRSRARSAAVVSAGAVIAGISSIGVAAVTSEANREPWIGEINRNSAAIVISDPGELQPIDGRTFGEASQTYYAAQNQAPAELPPPTVELTYHDFSGQDFSGGDLSSQDQTDPATTIIDRITNAVTEIVPADAELVPYREARLPEGQYPLTVQSGSLSVLIADDALLEAFSVPQSARAEIKSAATITAVTGTADAYPYYQDYQHPFDPTMQQLYGPITEVGVEGQVGEPRLWVTEQVAIERGLEIAQTGVLAVASQPLTDRDDELAAATGQLERSYEIGETAFEDVSAFDLNPTADRPNQPPPAIFSRLFTTEIEAEAAQLVETIAIAMAIGLTLVIVGIGLALSARESRRDRAVVVANGARPTTIRWMVATDAWALAFVGIALGVPAALFCAWAVTTTTFDDSPATGVPIRFVLIMVLAVPILVGLLAGLASLFRRSVDTAQLVTTE